MFCWYRLISYSAVGSNTVIILFLTHKVSRTAVTFGGRWELFTELVPPMCHRWSEMEGRPYQWQQVAISQQNGRKSWASLNMKMGFIAGNNVTKCVRAWEEESESESEKERERERELWHSMDCNVIWRSPSSTNFDSIINDISWNGVFVCDSNNTLPSLWLATTFMRGTLFALRKRSGRNWSVNKNQRQQQQQQHLNRSKFKIVSNLYGSC